MDASKYQQTIYALDAVNVSGVIRSLDEILTAVQETPEARVRGTPYIATHPLIVLHVLKLYDMIMHASGKTDDYEVFAEAYKACKEAAGIETFRQE